MDESFEVYRVIISELRRRGRVDEVGRLALAALKLGKTADDLLQDAAYACLTVDDPEGALRHLQVAYQSNSQDPRTLDLLARSFEAGDEPQKARPILIALSGVLVKERRYSDRVPVLERALAVSDGDQRLESDLMMAKQAEKLAQFRLTMLSEAAPANDAQVRAAVRMSVLSRYGFGERALGELCELEQEITNSPAIQAHEAEARVELGQVEEALELAGMIAASLSEQGQDQVAQRIAVLTGGDLSKWLGAVVVDAEDEEGTLGEDEDSGGVDVDLLDAAFGVDDLVDDDLVDDDLVDDDLVDDDIMDSSSELAVPASAEPSSVEPSDMESLLGAEDDGWIDDSGAESGLGDLFNADGELEVDPDEFSDDQAPLRSDSALFDEAESLLLLGMADEALSLISDLGGLRSATMAARCMKELGDLSGAVSKLSDAIDSGDEDDEGMADALFLVADLIGRTKKHRAALRYLRELQDLHPNYNPSDVERRIAALKMVLGR